MYHDINIADDNQISCDHVKQQQHTHTHTHTHTRTQQQKQAPHQKKK